MLTKWGLTNFKSIYSAEIELAPLTVFTGTNSSGKSSFIQSMLLVMQSLAHKSPRNTLMKNGELVLLGEYSDIFNYSAKESASERPVDSADTGKSSRRMNVITISYGIDNISGEFTFGEQKDNFFGENLKPCILSSKISVSSVDHDSVQVKSELNITDCSRGLAEEFEFDQNSEHEFLLKKKEHNMINPHILVEQFLPSRIEFNSETKSDNFFVDLPFALQQAVYKLRNAFTASFNYISSFREEPRAIYLYPPKITINPSGVGARGENAAAVVAENNTKKIRYIPSKCFSRQETGEYYSEEAELSFALNDWMCYLGLVESIGCKREKLGYVLNINMKDHHAPDEIHTPVHVGAGVSNALPVVVMCLIAGPDSTLVFEEPELHLHPRVQSRLADFFLSMTLLEKQCIIETHSEYLIYNLRYRISKSLMQNDDSIRRKIKLLFAENNGGRSEFQEIKVNRHGEISAWPDGFFDERQKLSERMLDNILSETEDEDA
jgi:predicted ATPase